MEDCEEGYRMVEAISRFSTLLGGLMNTQNVAMKKYMENALNGMDAHTTQAKELIRVGKLDPNDPRAIILIAQEDQQFETETV